MKIAFVAFVAFFGLIQFSYADAPAVPLTPEAASQLLHLAAGAYEVKECSYKQLIDGVEQPNKICEMGYSLIHFGHSQLLEIYLLDKLAQGAVVRWGKRAFIGYTGCQPIDAPESTLCYAIQPDLFTEHMVSSSNGNCSGDQFKDTYKVDWKIEATEDGVRVTLVEDTLLNLCSGSSRDRQETILNTFHLLLKRVH